MKKVLIIDDEPLARTILVEYLASYPDLQVCGECANGFEGVKAIAQQQPDLVFLDVQMPKITGFEMLELIDDPPAVIFTTAFDEFAIKAFEANAIDYLLKPFSKSRFDEAMTKWLARKEPVATHVPAQLAANDEKDRIVVRSNNDIQIIPVSDIDYFEAYDDYVKIFTRQSWFLKKKTMSHYEKVLGEDKFARVHRSFMISISQLTKIEPAEKGQHCAILRSGKRIPLSRAGYVRLRQLLGL